MRAQTQGQGILVTQVRDDADLISGWQWREAGKPVIYFGVKQITLATFLKNWMELQCHLLKWVEFMENAFRGKIQGAGLCMRYYHIIDKNRTF